MTTPQHPTLGNLDLTLDVATLLRQGTSIAHEIAENSEGAAWLTRGELDRDEYTRFLIMLWHIYSAIEEGLDQHATHPVLAPTYNPALLARVPALSADIAHLLSVSESAWQAHPLAVSITQSPPAPLAAYTQRIRALTSSPDPSALMAHAYVRYLGDLSGGQVIRRRVAKAYNLDAVAGLGTQFYEFQKLGDGGVATVRDMRTIKSWYREGMNKGAGHDQERKAALVAEANIAFQLNGSIFSTLRSPSKERPVQSVDVVSTVTKSEQGPFTVAGVLAFILAMGIAHFVLVTGGFLGDAGLDKWERAREWVEGTLGLAA